VPTKPSWINFTTAQREEIERVLPCPGSRLLPGNELPSVFPDTLRKKILSAFVISEQTSTGGAYLVFSADRVDEPARAVDIEPFGLIVHSSGPGPRGVFLHHGDWEGRSEWPPVDFWEEVSRRGISSKLLEGKLPELPGGHRGAFNAVIRELRAREDGTKA
jgi:hypothetical protein